MFDFEANFYLSQVIGDGNRRMMTLAHKAQVRRFTSDLLRVLKSLASKQTTIAEFPSLFEKTLNRTFDPTDYGLCTLEDLLAQVSENTIVISATPGSADNTKNPQEIVIAIPKREQTAEEIERTKVFANEVIKSCFLLYISCIYTSVVENNWSNSWIKDLLWESFSI